MGYSELYWSLSDAGREAATKRASEVARERGFFDRPEPGNNRKSAAKKLPPAKAEPGETENGVK